jgi:hypothetical protein
MKCVPLGDGFVEAHRIVPIDDLTTHPLDEVQRPEMDMALK